MLWMLLLTLVRADTVLPAQLTASVDQGTINPGDTVRYTLDIERNADVTVTVSDPAGQLGGLPIVDSGSDPERPMDGRGRLRQRRWYTVRATQPGVYSLQAPNASYQTTDGGTLPLQAQEVLLQVGPSDADATLEDIKPIVALHYWPRWLPYVGAAALALGLGALGWWWLKRRAKPATEVVLSPHEIAFAALDRLRRTNFADDEAVRRYYFALSEVLRNYVEGRFNINATDLTSEELLARLPSLVGLRDSEQAILKEFLSLTDPVKYANYTPGGPEIAQCYELALQFVETTRPASPSEAA